MSGERLTNALENLDENMIKLSEFANLKSIRNGILGMTLFFIVLIFISTYKNVDSSALVSMLCAYDSTTFLSRYKLKHEKSDLFAGILFFIAVICNTISFILN